MYPSFAGRRYSLAVHSCTVGKRAGVNGLTLEIIPTTKVRPSKMTRHEQRGQSLVEAGLTIGLLIVMVLGIIEFGYDFFSLNMVTNAARDGARVASALQNRGTCGGISDSSSIPPLVRNQLAGIVTVDGGCTCSAGVCVDQCVTTSGGSETCGVPPANNCPAYTGTDIPTVKVTVAGHLPVLFGLLGPTGFNFCRAVTFRDEGR